MMARYALPDEYQVGSLQGGLPTCVFTPKTYHRVITNIVVGNSVTSEVTCYRGILGSTPVAQNLLGANNTLRGSIGIPAGQAFFVQWSAVGSSPSEAFARVSWERDDNPLEGDPTSALGQEWASNAITSLQVPTAARPNEPAIIIGSDLPPCMQTSYTAAVFFRPPDSLFPNSAPYHFMAQQSLPGLTGQQNVDYGFLVNDGTTCGYVVTRRVSALYDSSLGEIFASEQVGQLGFNNLVVTDIDFQITNTDFDIFTPINWNSATSTAVTDNAFYNSNSLAFIDNPGGGVGPILGMVFTVSPNGSYSVSLNAYQENSVAGQAAMTSYEIRDGAVIGAGALIVGPTDDITLDHRPGLNNLGNRSGIRQFTSDTPGDIRNIRLMHRVTGGVGRWGRRHLVVTPEI